MKSCILFRRVYSGNNPSIIPASLFRKWVLKKWQLINNNFSGEVPVGLIIPEMGFQPCKKQPFGTGGCGRRRGCSGDDEREEEEREWVKKMKNEQGCSGEIAPERLLRRGCSGESKEEEDDVAWHVSFFGWVGLPRHLPLTDGYRLKKIWEFSGFFARKKV